MAFTRRISSQPKNRPASGPPIPGPACLRVGVVDDEAEVRRVFSRAITSFPGMDCVGVFPSGELALEEVPTLEVDVVLMDIRMPGMGGIECSEKLLLLQPGIRIVIVSGVLEASILDQCLEMGVAGYIVKPVPLKQLFAAIWFWGRSIGRPASRADLGGWDGTAVSAALNADEEAVLEQLAAGLFYKEIELLLMMSSSKLRKTQHRVFEKMGLRTRNEAREAWIWWTENRSKYFQHGLDK